MCSLLKFDNNDKYLCTTYIPETVIASMNKAINRTYTFKMLNTVSYPDIVYRICQKELLSNYKLIDEIFKKGLVNVDITDNFKIHQLNQTNENIVNFMIELDKNHYP
jgi:hypothetical protein